MSPLKKWDQIKKFLEVTDEGLVLVAMGTIVAVIIVVMSPTISVMSSKMEMSSDTEMLLGGVSDESPILIAHVNADEMHEEFECACCGKNIGDCSCGMATGIKTYLQGLAAGGLDKKNIYKEMVKKYTVDILFNEALAAEIKGELIAEAPADRPILELAPASIDVGKISMAKGEVERVYRIKNAGLTDLIITGIESSCMCTSAILRNNGQDSPVFGMHDNPTDWSTTIAPGSEAELVVIFDPNAHGPDAVGVITRTVSVHSNDVIDAAKKVRFEGEVVK